MIDLRNMSFEELMATRTKFLTQVREAQKVVDACWAELGRRDSEVMLATANAAKERARTGICTNGIGDCPVHQMGSCKPWELQWPGYKTACD